MAEVRLGKELRGRVQCARLALAGLVRHAPTAFSFVLCVREAAQAEASAEVDADVAADRPTRSTSAAPTTERRRRGSSGRVAQREAV
jgi:hypothetical protein